MTYRFPSLNGLKAFEAAARHLSFIAAASELGVTAGAVSQQVKRLETKLGVSLFRRLPQGLILTDAGRQFQPKISEAFDFLTDATEEIAPALNGRKFTIGISPGIRELLPAGWPRHGGNVTAYVGDVIETEDAALIWSNELDGLLEAIALVSR